MEAVSSKKDEELVRDTLHNKEAFAYLIERYEAKLRRYLRRITNVSDSDIDDLLQDSFIKAYQNLNSFDASFPFSSWMYRITRNTAISDHRKRVARPHDSVFDDEAVLLLIADDTDIEKSAIRGEVREEMKTVIARLRPEYRDVLTLRFYEGMSYDEISDIMMKPRGTVATLLNRAKGELRTILQAYE